jgi:hypothetical protein
MYVYIRTFIYLCMKVYTNVHIHKYIYKLYTTMPTGNFKLKQEMWKKKDLLLIKKGTS